MQSMGIPTEGECRKCKTLIRKVTQDGNKRYWMCRRSSGFDRIRVDRIELTETELTESVVDRNRVDRIRS